MPFLLTRTKPEDLKTDAKVFGSCPYARGSREPEWQLDLQAEQRRINRLLPGEVLAISSRGFKCCIAAMPPIWEGGERKEMQHLGECYEAALQLAARRRCRSIAFPLLSGDCNGFPRDLALHTAIHTIREFLNRHEMLVYLSVKDSWARSLPRPSIPALSRKAREDRLSTQALFEQAISRTVPEKNLAAPAAEVPDGCPAEAPAAPFSFSKPLDHLVKNPQGSFSAGILQWIDEKNLKDPQVYQKANLDRRLFSKLRSNPAYQPSKATALALCLALELTLPQTEEMLKKAGYALSDSNTFDIILKYYISQGNYDIYQINQALFVYEQPLLGAG